MQESMTYNRLIDIAKANRQYLCGEYDPNGSRTVNMVWDIMSTLHNELPDVNNGFSVGFPFYSINQASEFMPNPEFRRYSNCFIEKLESTQQKLGNIAWKCEQCQDQFTYNPANCRSCEDEEIKPRQIMRVMPDVDIFMVVDQLSSPILDQIQTTASNHSFHQSDLCSCETLQRIANVLDNFKANRPNQVYLPTDLHVISKTDFMTAIKDIESGDTAPKPNIYSMYYDWERNQGIDFWFDFVFSSTFNDDLCQPEIITQVNRARKSLVQRFDESTILNMVTSRNQRAETLLKHEPTRQIFTQRLRSWEEL